MKAYLIIAAIFAVVIGYATWQKQKADNAKLETKAVRASLTMAEVELQNAEVVNKTALDAIAAQAREVERQKLIAAAEAKKSRERLNAYNALNRKIGNVPASENVPVSSHLELLLDSERMRGVVPGDRSRPDSADEGVNSGEAGPSGHDLPAETPPTS
jgi:hypothetical protein